METSVLPVGVERLRMLYAMLVGVPENKVLLSTWRSRLKESDAVGDDKLLNGCGTTACAVGWACAYPPFKEMGLSYGYVCSYQGTYQPKLEAKNGAPEVAHLYEGRTKFDSWEAVQNFFGISYNTAYSLFMPHDDISKNNFVDKDLGDRVLTDAQKVLMRIRNYLFQRDFISAERNEQLKAAERKGTLLQLT